MFFERYIEWLKDTHGEPANWPPTLNFCRVVRNACAHGHITLQTNEQHRSHGVDSVLVQPTMGVTLSEPNFGSEIFSGVDV
jgi:hypothetical protein